MTSWGLVMNGVQQEKNVQTGQCAGECLSYSPWFQPALSGVMMYRAWRAALPPLYQQRNTTSLWCLTPWLVSLVAAAANETAIHHRPTVSSEAVTDKANRINKALAQALLVCTQTSLPSFLSQMFPLSFHTSYVSCLFFSPPLNFSGDIIYLCRTTTTVNIISICPSAWP